MRDGLPLAGVLSAVTSVEQTTTDGDEGVVEVTKSGELRILPYAQKGDLRLEEAVSVAVDGVDRGIIGDGDMTRSETDEFTVLLMEVVDDLEAVPPTGLDQQPEVGEPGDTGGGNGAQMPSLEVGDDVVGGNRGEEEVGRVDGGEIGDHAR